MALPTKMLGRSGLALPPVVLGGNVFGWTADIKTSLDLLDAALGGGLNAIDTADMYSTWVEGHEGGESEAIIGAWMKERKNRSQVKILTKVGMAMGHHQASLSKARIFAAVEASLTRLQTDYIDLYQAHQDDPETPLEETLGAFAELIKQGKVKAIGASNYTAPRLKAALDVAKANNLPRYESLQPLYNLMERPAFEDELQSLCIAEEVGTINYFALAAGFLSGKYKSKADCVGRRGESAKKYLATAKGKAVIAALLAQAQRIGAAPSEVAIAWCREKSGITAPIASATSLSQMQSLIRAAALELDKDCIAALDEASA
ncbi:aldo/keto reductase [Acidocella facilis]|uniref:aldo/keto reductase n=1 Tax=Acidocella facilis TaxID=525 RepID=UPI001F2EF8F4|nr:aldo/keto reductase [Acidocella facilis]